MSNTKSLVFAITSLTFLVSGAICSQLFVLPVYAAKPDPCFDYGCTGDTACIDNPERLTYSCCWTTFSGNTACQTCDINTDTGDFENCFDTIVLGGKTDGSTIVPPTSGVAPPPTTETCPENTARNSRGICTPLTQGPQETSPSPSPDGPKEITPQVDCNENPDDPLCETATIPEGETEEQQPGEGSGEDSSGGERDSSDGGNNPDEG